MDKKDEKKQRGEGDCTFTFAKYREIGGEGYRGLICRVREEGKPKATYFATTKSRIPGDLAEFLVHLGYEIRDNDLPESVSRTSKCVADDVQFDNGEVRRMVYIASFESGDEGIDMLNQLWDEMSPLLKK